MYNNTSVENLVHSLKIGFQEFISLYNSDNVIRELTCPHWSGSRSLREGSFAWNKDSIKIVTMSPEAHSNVHERTQPGAAVSGFLS